MLTHSWKLGGDEIVLEILNDCKVIQENLHERCDVGLTQKFFEMLYIPHEVISTKLHVPFRFDCNHNIVAPVELPAEEPNNQPSVSTYWPSGQ